MPKNVAAGHRAHDEGNACTVSRAASTQKFLIDEEDTKGGFVMQWHIVCCGNAELSINWQ